MEDEIIEPEIAYCGLYCYECRWHSEGKCLGCKMDEGSKACPIYQCASSKQGLMSCQHCTVFYKDCETWRRGILFKRKLK
ncbi:MAG: hypothetical protein ACE5GD_09715 [Candidatus Geothermarchaeales archaeon]